MKSSAPLTAAPAPVGALRTAGLTALPAGLALLCQLGRFLPENWVWTQVAMATLLAAPPFLMALWPLWALGVGRRTRRWVIPALGGIAGAICAGVPPALLAQNTSGIRLVVANVNAYPDTPQKAELETALGALEADIVIVIEQRPSQIPGMVRIADNFEDDLPRISHATAIFCRQDAPSIECEAMVTPEFGSDSFQMPVGLVRVGANLCIMGIHGPPPAPYDPTGLQPYVQKIADTIENGRLNKDWGPCQQGDPLLVSGDLNAPPGHPVHSMLLDKGLRDELRWFGIWATTWPAGGGWPNLPYFQLDHVLSGDVSVENVQFLRLPGADHKALSMTLVPS